MSDINGEGYGSSHNWKFLETHGRDSIHMECLTEYECINCKIYFRHFYNRPGLSEIFTAIKEHGIPNICK